MFLVFAFAAVPFSYGGALRPGQTLTVRDVNGEVRVRSGDRLSIRATKHARSGDPNEVRIHVEQRSDGTVVCVRYPPDAGRGCDEGDSRRVHGADNDTAVDFDITLPRGARLDATTVNGSIDARTDGPVSATAVNGGISLDAPQIGSARTVNGPLRLRVRDGGRGTLLAKTVTGSIEVELPRGAGVVFDAKTLTGGISAEGVTVTRPEYGPGATAHATLGDGSHRVDCETVTGSITLRR
ncbi:MAG: hypothetical protein QOI11_1284 [Candidatus Eremiobacteraeota bacterium]|jgi:hypothetical protein|nr:hypothetical protein [Candidatus Eremiobacteraeota bacterium]